MDLKIYYQKLREHESRMPEAYAVVVSLETPDGGRAGVLTEASRRIAAKLILEGKARLATMEEVKAFREELAEARRDAQRAALASKAQVTLLSEPEIRRPGGTPKSKV